MVDWNGSESSADPSPTIEGVSSIGGGSSNTLSIVAIVIGVVAILLAGASLLSSGRRSLT